MIVHYSYNPYSKGTHGINTEQAILIKNDLFLPEMSCYNICTTVFSSILCYHLLMMDYQENIYCVNT